MRRAALAVALGLMIFSLSPAVVVRAQNQTSIQKGATEWGLHSGGAFAVAGGRTSRSYAMLAGRWGRVLTEDRGPGLLRGKLEYSLEAIPLVVMSQSSTVYAAGFTPLLLRWNFTSARRIVPFIEVGAGILGSSADIPEGTSRFNFIDQGTVGLLLMSSNGRSWQLGARYVHISNAGLADQNPGVNSIYLFGGFSWWK